MSKGKQTSTQNTNQTTNFNSSSKGTAPDWITTALQGVTGKINTLGNANPQSYVAGVNPLQNQAGTSAAGLTGSPWNYDAASDLTRGVAQANAPQIKGQTASPYIDNYMDPYLSSVVNATKADLDQAAGQSRAQFDLSNAQDFGGSGVAIGKALNEGQILRGMGTTLGNLRSQGYSQALGAAQSDADRAQQAKALDAQLYAQQMDRALAAANQLGNISSAADANTRANALTQEGVGEALRGVAQQQASAPLTLASWQSQTYPDLLRGLFGQDTTGTQHTNGTTTGTVTSNPGILSSLGNIAAIASLFA